MKNMFSPCPIFAGIVAILLASGCVTLPDTADPTGKLAQQKDIARQWAEKLKSDSAVNAAALKTAEVKVQGCRFAE